MSKIRFGLYFLIIGLLTLAFSIVMGFLLESYLPLELENARLLYYISKGLATFALLAMLIYAVFFKKEPANLAIQLTATLIYQFLPLLIRYLMTRKEPFLIFSVTIIFLTTIIYLALVLALDLLTARIKQVETLLEGNNIPVVNEDDYYDENGRFVSAVGKAKEK